MWTRREAGSRGPEPEPLQASLAGSGSEGIAETQTSDLHFYSMWVPQNYPRQAVLTRGPGGEAAVQPGLRGTSTGRWSRAQGPRRTALR